MSWKADVCCQKNSSLCLRNAVPCNQSDLVGELRIRMFETFSWTLLDFAVNSWVLFPFLQPGMLLNLCVGTQRLIRGRRWLTVLGSLGMKSMLSPSSSDEACQPGIYVILSMTSEVRPPFV